MENKIFADIKLPDNSEQKPKNILMERKGSHGESSSPRELPVVTITVANMTGIPGQTGTPKCLTEAKRPLLGKAEINEAVTKVLQGYNWSLVPSPTK
ncbi:hypothetical protein RUM44_002992 [Polyplax serrata]|uniref:Sox developmental protein N-terminal domain-containing protein n=1 Tax=Polyplax serrata TaxID=468196 RepID=A0ABR1AXE2_POLSC